MKRYDFIAVGAGPAGLSTAEILAKGGAKTLVIDKKKEIGKPLACGEGMTEFSLKKIDMNDGRWIRHRLKGYKIIMPNGSSIRIDEKMVIISRYLFENELYRRALSEGAQFSLDTEVKSIKRVEGGYKLSTEKEDFSSRFIIGADGPVSVVGNFIDAYKKRFFVAASINRVKRIDEGENYQNIFFSSEYPHGYGYIFPAGSGNFNAGVVAKGINLFMKNKEFLKKHGFDRVDYSNMAPIPMIFKMRYYSKEGIMLTGDAAGLVSSVSYGGMYPAIISGRLAGTVGIENMSSSEKEPFKEYYKRLRKEEFFEKNQEKNHNRIYFLSDTDLNLLGNLVKNRNFEEVSPLEVISLVFKSKKFYLLKNIISIFLYSKFKIKYG